MFVFLLRSMLSWLVASCFCASIIDSLLLISHVSSFIIPVSSYVTIALSFMQITFALDAVSSNTHQ